jgi:hypothetical protein
MRNEGLSETSQERATHGLALPRTLDPTDTATLGNPA